MAVTTKKTFPATSNATTTVFSPVGIQLNNQDDLDVYVTLSGGTRVLQLRQATASTAVGSGVNKHPQVNDTTGLYFPAVTAGTNLINYTLSTDNNTITFNSALPQGAVVFCERRTRDADGTYTTFASGSTIRATDLNNSSTESNFTAQDGRNKAFTIEGALFNGDQPSTNFVTSSHIVDGSIVNADINASADIAGSKLADDSVTRAKLEADIIDSTKIENGAVGHEHLQANSVRTDKIQDNAVTLAKLGSGALPTDITVASANIVNGTILEEDVSNSAITANKLADNAVTTTEILNGAVTADKLATNAVTTDKILNDAITNAKIGAGAITNDLIATDAVTNAKIANNSIDSEHYVDGSIDREHLSADIIDSTKIENGAIGHEHLQADAVRTAKIEDNAVTIDKIADGNIVTQSEQASHTVNDNTFFTTAAAEARFFNVSSGETIKDGDTFPDNDNTIATTAAINDRIIDIVNDVGGFDIIESEQHFPNTNPQGQAGSAAVLSIKAASTNLVPSGTTVTIVNGNLANNANITITGVTSTIPSGFGFIVESTGTLHTYTFHRLVPKATEVTTVAGKATEIGRLGTAAAVEDMSILGTADVVADLNTLGTADVVADMNMLATSDVVSDMNTLAVASVLSDMDTVATNVTNVNNVGNNITNVNSVSNSAGSNQTFTVTVQNVSGNKYFIDTAQTPVLKLARGKTYTFDMSDSSNSGHPLAFRDSSDNSYTTGVTTSGTAGSSGATVVIVVAANAPSSLKYYCTSHGNGMGNTITVIDDNVGIVAGSISNVNIVGGDISNVNTTASSISNVNTVATNINSVNNFFNVYRTGANNPTTSLDVGDLFFNTTSNSLKVYTGSAWVDGVTATGNFAVVTGNTFTGSNNHNDNVKSIYGNANDLQIYHDGGTNSYLMNNTGTLRIRGNDIRLQNINGETYTKHLSDGAVFLAYDNATKLETRSNGITVTGYTYSDGVTIGNGTAYKYLAGSGNQLQMYHTGSGGNGYLVNSTGTLHLGGGTVGLTNAAANAFLIRAIAGGAAELYHNGTKKLETNANGNELSGTLQVLQGDVKFDNQANAGYDLRWDESLNRLHFEQDNIKAVFGTGSDLEIFHDGNSRILNNSGGGHILIQGNGDTDKVVALQPKVNENGVVVKADAAAELYYDHSKKLNTAGFGVKIFGEIDVEDADPKIYLSATSGTDYYFHNDAGTFKLRDEAASNAVRYQLGADGVHYIYGNTNVMGTSDLTVVGGDLKLTADNAKLQLGAGQDLELYHTGSGSYIDNTSTGHLFIRGNGTDAVLIRAKAGENGVAVHSDGDVSLYHNGIEKLQTTSIGCNLIDDDTTAALLFTTSSGNAGYVLGEGDNIIGFKSPDAEWQVKGLKNGAVELYYDNSKKLETATHGALISANSDIRFTSGNWTGEGCKIQHTSNYLYIQGGSNGMFFRTNAGQNVWVIGSNGYLVPNTDSTYDIGTNTVRVRNGYFDTLYGDGSNLTGINTDLVSDTTPQLGGDLDNNGNDILLDDSGVIRLGSTSGGDMKFFHNGTNGVLTNVTGDMQFRTDQNFVFSDRFSYETFAKFKDDSACELYFDNSKKIETTSVGTQVTGVIETVSTPNADPYAGFIARSSGANNHCGFFADAATGANAQSHIRFGYSGSPKWQWRVPWHAEGTTAGMWLYDYSIGDDVIKISQGGNQSIRGHVSPRSNNTYDLGTSSTRWRNIYTNDLHLSNEGHSNEVDGSWGDWTIQEGESDLFLKNNRSGKKYKFNLTEVS